MIENSLRLHKDLLDLSDETPFFVYQPSAPDQSILLVVSNMGTQRILEDNQITLILCTVLCSNAMFVPHVIQFIDKFNDMIQLKGACCVTLRAYIYQNRRSTHMGTCYWCNFGYQLDLERWPWLVQNDS